MQRLTPILTAALFGAIALAGCRQQEDTAATPTTPPATEPAPAAEPAAPAASATVIDVQLGTEAAENAPVAEPKTSFAPTDDTIIASVSTATSDPGANVDGTLVARWTYQDGQLVDESSETLSFSGTGVTNFRINNPEPWPEGKYKLEILLNDAVVQTREFTVE
ncbi:hypothetical protein [Luteimonas suaedae]|uniref:hypothetical protein n=1 Tax=Luteimonas suaedae TaxID=2605430 RepID=UPI0011ED4707|nr:hypothetical protein [Luteimonas suaedae]